MRKIRFDSQGMILNSFYKKMASETPPFTANAIKNFHFLGTLPLEGLLTGLSHVTKVTTFEVQMEGLT